MSEQDEGDFPRQPEDAIFREIEPSVQAVLMSAVARYNELVEKRGDSTWKIPVSDISQFDLVIRDRGNNNQLAVAVKHQYGRQRFARIGHYDPGMQRFLYYPELLRSEEAPIIQDLATKRRLQAVHEHPIFDYDSDEIRDLHRKHREVLLDGGLIYELAKRHNEFIEPEDHPKRGREYLINDRTIDHTSIHACLMPNHDREEALVAISLHGGLFSDHGVLRRESLDHLYIGERAPTRQYMPYRRIISDVEFGKVLALTNELQQLKASSLPTLNTGRVALRGGR